jgi:hypothetical protein
VVVDRVTQGDERMAVYHPIDEPMNRIAIPHGDLTASVVRDGRVCPRFERVRWGDVVPT